MVGAYDSIIEWNFGVQFVLNDTIGLWHCDRWLGESEGDSIVIHQLVR
jgi:hypothetical protein